MHIPGNACYLQEISLIMSAVEMDAWIGAELIPLLNTPGIRDNTIVLITSEHGEEFLEHGRVSHETLYDTNVNVPFILRIPGISARTMPDPVQGADVAPTVPGAVGIPQRTYGFQGLDLTRYLSSGRLPDRFIYAFQINDSCRTVATVRDRIWKVFMANTNGVPAV